MPDKLEIKEIIGMGVISPVVVGGVTAMIGAGISVALGHPPVTGGMVGATIGGAGVTFLSAAASSMADDSNGLKLLLLGSVSTAALAFGIHFANDYLENSPIKTADVSAHKILAASDQKSPAFNFAALKSGAHVLVANKEMKTLSVQAQRPQHKTMKNQKLTMR